MPYIKPSRRFEISNDLVVIDQPGDLNFAITQLIDRYMGEIINYRKINEVVGVLECAKLELYRRVAAPYEDGKCAQNGDVYTDIQERLL